MRYVDNLLMLQLKVNGEDAIPRVFKSMGFYGGTIELEYEQDLRYLGVEIKCTPTSFEVDYVVPGYSDIQIMKVGAKNWQLKNKQWRYRSPAAGTSEATQVAGLTSRLHMATRFAYPLRRKQVAIAKLLAVHVQLGHTTRRIMLIVKKSMPDGTHKCT